MTALSYQPACTTLKAGVHFKGTRLPGDHTSGVPCAQAPARKGSGPQRSVPISPSTAGLPCSSHKKGFPVGTEKPRKTGKKGSGLALEATGRCRDPREARITRAIRGGSGTAVCAERSTSFPLRTPKLQGNTHRPVDSKRCTETARPGTRARTTTG